MSDPVTICPMHCVEYSLHTGCPRCKKLIDGAGAGVPAPVKSDGAKKFDAAKLPVVAGAINYFPRALMALASNSEYGFRKYGAWGGWRNVPDGQRRYTDADGRHLVMEPIEGAYDAESGIAHAIMHAWNAMARVEKMLEEGAIELRRGNEIGPDGKPVPGTHRVVNL